MIAVVQFPGSNCDEDTRFVLGEVCGADVRMVWHREESLNKNGDEVEAVVIPGGFSYGDYLRSGALAALSPVMADVKRFADAGGPVLGICNGFQVLTEAGLLPGQLARNPALHFKCQPVTLRVERTDTVFTGEYTSSQVISLPIAHNEGRYYADDEVLAGLKRHNQILFRYCTPTGEPTEAANPNDSLENIAGIVNERGNVLGMMPHPERASEAVLGGADGLPLFMSLLNSLRAGIMV